MFEAVRRSSNLERAVFGNAKVARISIVPRASSSRELLAPLAFPNTARPMILKRLLRWQFLLSSPTHFETQNSFQ